VQGQSLDQYAIQVITQLGDAFYKHVPLNYRTHCSLTSRISQRVLGAFSIPAQLLPCQAWCVTPDQNYVVGFLGRYTPGKWDGHVVCVAGDFFIDAALYHFQKEFGVGVPNVVVSRIFRATTTVISRVDLDPRHCLWWHQPPADRPVAPPDEPESVIALCAAALVQAITAQIEGLRPPVARKT